jgi:hypothetical protein
LDQIRDQATAPESRMTIKVLQVACRGRSAAT